MLQLEVGEFTAEEWSQIVAEFSGMSLMQTWEYAQVKALLEPWTVQRLLFRNGSTIVGAAQVLVRELPFFDGVVIRCNRAPLWQKCGEPGDSALLSEMLRALRQHWGARKHVYLSVAPPALESEVSVSDLEAVGYHPYGVSGWASAVLDLSKSEEQLRTELRGNWRRDLAKAEKSGVTCTLGDSPQQSERFLQHYEAFRTNRGFSTTVTLDLLKNLQQQLPPSRKMLVFDGWKEDEYLGGLLAATYNDTVMILATVLTDAGRKAQGGNVMYWESILTAKKLGYRWLDAGGLDPETTQPGISHFKQGLRGTPYRLCPEVEAVSGSWVSKLVRWRVHRLMK